MTQVSCVTCKQQCDKPYQLPECRHVFCKKCLSEYFNSLSSWTDEPDHFSCSECERKIKKPDLPVSKWIKQFKMYKTATFFTKDTDMLPHGDIESGSDSVPLDKCVMATGHRKVKSSTFLTRSNSVDPSFQETQTGSESVKFREESKFKHRSLHRTAMRLSKYTSEKAFESKISSDKHDCVYFGGDTVHDGNLLLADWLNSSVKMFEPSGQFVCKIMLDEAPLDVTEVAKGLIVVSFGSKSRMVIFLKYKESEKELKILGGNSLQGYLYSTTRYEGTCVGVFEKDATKTCSIVEVSIEKFVKKIGAPRHSVRDVIPSGKNIEISSESGLAYDHTDRRLYVTSRRKLLCFRKGRLIFQNSYAETVSGSYILGSVVCDERGLVYIASDHSILRVSKDGDLISVVQLPTEPYHITTTQDQRKLAILGKQNEILYFSIEKRANLTLST